MDKIDEAYFLPTAMIDSDSPLILEHAEKIIGTAKGSAIDKAIKLFYAVRDGICQFCLSHNYMIYLYPLQMHTTLQPRKSRSLKISLNRM